jgi:hypothetical protein
MTGLARLRGFRLVLPLAVAGTLLALPARILAQEVDIPETTDLADPVEDAAEDLQDQTDIDLDELTAKELRKLCRARPELQTTKECRKVLRRASSVGGGGGTAPEPISASTRTSSGGGATAKGASRGQGAGSRPRIDVQKTNDADGDGDFSAAEVSSRSGADVPFRARIKNEGRAAVTIQRVTDSYQATTIEVCDELIGDRLPPGKSAVCNFTLEDYAPPPNDSRANTLRVVVKETQGNRTASDSDISTVTTLNGGDNRVLGTTESNPDSGTGGSKNFAETGFYLTRLMALAMALLTAGAALIRLGRRRPAIHTAR